MSNIGVFTNNGRFLMLALDHRESVKKMILKKELSGGLDKKIVDYKLQIIKATYAQFSSALFDVKYSYRAYQQFIQQSNITPPKPYLLAIEKSGYQQIDGERITEIQYSVEELKNLGASGIKLLLYFNPQAKTAQQQLQTAKKILDDCQKKNLPLFLEIVTYEAYNNQSQPLRLQIDSGPASPAGRQARMTNYVTESIKMFLEQKIIPDVFKLEFPGDEKSCQKITQLLGNPKFNHSANLNRNPSISDAKINCKVINDGYKTPWILLTAGESFEQFKNNLEIAVKNGCAGFLAGRALWQELFQLPEEKKEEFLAITLPKRFKEINSLLL